MDMQNLKSVIPAPGEPGHEAAVREAACALLDAFPGQFHYAVENLPGYTRPPNGEVGIALAALDLAVGTVRAAIEER